MPRPVSHEGNRLLDHFASLDEFEEELSFAGERAKTVEAKDFVRSLNSRYAQYREKLYVSKSQADWLKDIANSAD